MHLVTVRGRALPHGGYDERGELVRVGLDPLERLLVYRGLVDIPRDHGAVVDHVPAVRAAREDVLG